VATFPNIQQPSYPFGNQLEDPAISSQMENGTKVSRARFTKSRETFFLKWNALPAADYYQLRDFYKNVVKGSSERFDWTYPPIQGDPYSGQVFTVRFAGGSPNFSLANYGMYSGEITLQED
jgi:hypothetical protein